MKFNPSLIIIWLVCKSAFCIAQDSIPAMPPDSIRYAIVEKFEADTATGIRDGRYRYFFDRHQLTEGFYKGGKKSGYWEFYDYEGALRIKGFYQDGKLHGLWKYYYNDGTLSSEVNYVQGVRNGSIRGYHHNKVQATTGVYKNDRQDSIWTTSDENGKVMERAYYNGGEMDSAFYYYTTGEVARITRYKGMDLFRNTVFFKNGKIFYDLLYHDGLPYQLAPVKDISGKQIKTADLIAGSGTLYVYYPPYDSSGKVSLTLRAMVNYQKGIATGSAEFYDEKGKLEEKGDYRNGFKTGAWLEYDGKEVDTTNYKPMLKDTVARAPKDLDVSSPRGDKFMAVETMPEFPGGESILIRYVSTIRYPAMARENDIEGSVYIRFVIDQFGVVTEVEVLKSADKILTEASLEHIKKLPQWTPGFQNGLPVKVVYVIPIKFKLQ